MVSMYGLRFVTTTSNIASMFGLTKDNVHDDMNQLKRTGVAVTSTYSFTIIDLTPLTNAPVESFHEPDTHSPDNGTSVPKIDT
ncbi:hypothetical protein, partial [Pseudothermotoga sp.]|uniref:hypothetical protein n=1 Tax=Pseudothermotoga sp. TaxID=2033661 RepID=UPI0031F6F1EB